MRRIALGLRTRAEPPQAGRAVAGASLPGSIGDEVSFHLHGFDTIRIGTEIVHGARLPVGVSPSGEMDALIGGDLLFGGDFPCGRRV